MEPQAKLTTLYGAAAPADQAAVLVHAVVLAGEAVTHAVALGLVLAGDTAPHTVYARIGNAPVSSVSVLTTAEHADATRLLRVIRAAGEDVKAIVLQRLTRCLEAVSHQAA